MFPICRSDFPLNWQNKWELSRILSEQYVSISLPKLTSSVRAVSTQSWPCKRLGWGTAVCGKLTSMEQFGQQNTNSHRFLWDTRELMLYCQTHAVFCFIPILLFNIELLQNKTFGLFHSTSQYFKQILLNSLQFLHAFYSVAFIFSDNYICLK